MSLDKSLRSRGSLVRHRNVLSRTERIEWLKDAGKWDEEKDVFGLPKVAHRKVTTKKVKAAAASLLEGAEAAAGAAAPAEGAAPAARGAPAKAGPAAKGAPAKAAPAAKGAPAKAAPAAKGPAAKGPAAKGKA